MAGAQHLRIEEGDGRQREAADEGADAARQVRLLQQRLDTGDRAHRGDADQGRGDADRGEIEEVDIAGRHLVRNADQRLQAEEGAADHGRRHRRHPDRRQGRERIGADHQLESIEGTGERRVEGGGDRGSGPAADQGAQILRRKRSPCRPGRRRRSRAAYRPPPCRPRRRFPPRTGSSRRWRSNPAATSCPHRGRWPRSDRPRRGRAGAARRRRRSRRAGCRRSARRGRAADRRP